MIRIKVRILLASLLPGLPWQRSGATLDAASAARRICGNTRAYLFSERVRLAKHRSRSSGMDSAKLDEAVTLAIADENPRPRT